MAVNFICRESVLDVLKKNKASQDIVNAVSCIAMFPAPNPDMVGGRNIMNQTEDEFWAAIDMQHKS